MKAMIEDLNKLLRVESPFMQGCGSSHDEGVAYLTDVCKVLVIGAGGLGCEILKCLALTGFRNITVVDMDTIDLSNLNRQFLFSEKDIGNSKAVIAAEYINRRFGHLGVNVNARMCKIQDLDDSFYGQFDIFIAGLDNIPARRWLNSTIFSLLERDAGGNVDPSSIRFLLDGGTEGFKGQARVIVPTMTACFECTLDTFPPVTTYPLCTIAETPRLPEHCVEYALTVLFDRAFPGKNFNADNQSDLDWLFEASLARATAFNISGVTKQLTKGVAKRIIPAVASTNALIAATLVNEAFKIATYSNPVMSNYFMYMGQTGINTQTIAYEKKQDCTVCMSSLNIPNLEISKCEHLSELLVRISSELRFSSPSLVNAESGKVVFMQNPPSLRAQLEYRLTETLESLISSGDLGEMLIVTDPAVRTPTTLRLTFT